jgi:hypothetical protein
MGSDNTFLWKHSHLQFKIVDNLILRRTFPFRSMLLEILQKQCKAPECLSQCVRLFNDVNPHSLACILATLKFSASFRCNMYTVSFLLTLQIKQFLNRIIILNGFCEHLLKYAKLTNSMELSLLEKPSIANLFKKYPTFYGTRRFIVVITRSRHWSALSQMNPVHSTASYSLRSILILSYLRLGLPSGLFPSVCTTKTLYAAPHVCYLRCPYYHPWLGRSNCICKTQTFSCCFIGLVAVKFGLSF